MSFRLSLAGKANKARTEEEEEEEARKLQSVLEEFREEHGDDSDDSDAGAQAAQRSGAPPRTAAAVPAQGPGRHFATRNPNRKAGVGTLDDFEPVRPGFMPQNPPRPEGKARQEHPWFSSLMAIATNCPFDILDSEIEELFKDYKTLNIVKMTREIPECRYVEFMREQAWITITFDKGASVREFEDAMNTMNDKKYLGAGYYLHLDRYLGQNLKDKEPPLPWGAVWVPVEEQPDRIAQTDPNVRTIARAPEMKKVIYVQMPKDRDTLKLIHIVIEHVIINGVDGGRVFETTLMRDPKYQYDERFAFLYDPYHPNNRYYRWKMHQMITGGSCKEIYQGHGEWIGPPAIKNEFAYKLAHIVDDDDPIPAPETEEEAEYNKRPVQTYPGFVDNGYGLMPAKSRFFLIHLLTTVPLVEEPDNVDICHFACFAYKHYNKGLDETVEILISNILRPLAMMPENDDYEARSPKDPNYRRDLRIATLLGFIILNDVAMANCDEGLWKYRDLVRSELKEFKIFEHLDDLPEKLEMGRLTTKKFRDQINQVIGIWREERFFNANEVDYFDGIFNWREKEAEKKERDHGNQLKRKREEPVVSDAAVPTPQQGKTVVDEHDRMEVEAMDVDIDDQNTANPLPVQSQILASSDGRSPSAQPKLSSSSIPMPTKKSSLEIDSKIEDNNSDANLRPADVPGETAAARARRMRPKAEDMFASDEE